MSQTAPQIFDRQVVRLKRDRTARLIDEGQFDDFLYRELARRLADNLKDVRRSFERVLDLGCRGGNLWPLIKDRCGDKFFVQADLSPGMACLAQKNGQSTLVLDEETLPFAPQSFDLVMAAGGLHWLNDIPGALKQIRRILKPDGLFLGLCISGDTLAQARDAMALAEERLSGGVSPRFSPSFDLATATGLLQGAGFALPVGDLQQLTLGYKQPLMLLQDLRAMAETNALTNRLKRFGPRNLIPAFLHELSLQQGKEVPVQNQEVDEVIFHFDLLFLSGWAPDPSQQQALKPGSATKSFSDIL